MPTMKLIDSASDLGLDYLLRPVFPNTYSKYGNLIKPNSLRTHSGPSPEKHTIKGINVDVQTDLGFRCPYMVRR